MKVIGVEIREQQMSKKSPKSFLLTLTENLERQGAKVSFKTLDQNRTKTVEFKEFYFKYEII